MSKEGSVGSLGSKLKDFRDKIAIKNWEPDDHGLTEIVTPNLGPEHLARYAFTRELFDRYGALPENGMTVVNLGSARGYGSDRLRSLFEKAKIILGIEIEPKYARTAKDKYMGNIDNQHGASESRLEMVVADATRIPMVDNSADLTVAYELLEHLPQDRQLEMLKEMKRTLKTNGLAIVSFPERYSFSSKNGRKRTGIASNPHHQYEPTVEEARDMMRNAGLEIVGEYGQFLVDKKEVKSVQRIARLVPAWPLYMWGINRDTVPSESNPENRDKVFLTHILVVRKSASDNSTPN